MKKRHIVFALATLALLHVQSDATAQHEQEFDTINILRDQALKYAVALHKVPNQSQKHQKLALQRIVNFYQNLANRNLQPVAQAFIETHQLAQSLVSDRNQKNIEGNVKKYYDNLVLNGLQLFAQEFIQALNHINAPPAHIPLIAVRTFITHNATLARDIVAYKQVKKKFPDHFENQLHADNFRYLDPLMKKSPEIIENFYYTSLQNLYSIHSSLHEALTAHAGQDSQG